MKILKHILFLLLAFLGFFQIRLEARPVVLEGDKTAVFAEQAFKEAAEEEWLSLLYLQEESADQFSFSHTLEESFFENFLGELRLKNHQSSHQSNFQTVEILKSHPGNGGCVDAVFHRTPELVDSWKVLHELNPKSFIKTDVARLEIFHKLSPGNQKLIAQFTDVDANSTLAKFLDDCNADPDFLSFVIIQIMQHR